MHELGVTQSILNVVLKYAQEAEASHVQRIHLVIGDLAGVVGESVQFYFDFISRGTLAEGAELVMQRDPARFRCPACGHEYEPEDTSSPSLLWACPTCGELRPEVIGGRMLQLESIEVDD
jgi:hydrogenase nickel incorporation protein HypA/HybF